MTTQYESDARPPQAVSRVGLYLPSGLLLMVALAWSGFWFYASRMAERGMGDWIIAEAAAGRSWTCADQAIGGFPFRIELRCASVSLATFAEGKPVQMRLGGLTALTQIYSPKLVLADLTAPFTIESDGVSSSLTWEGLRASIRFAGQAQRLSLAATQPRLNWRDGAGIAYDVEAKAAEFHLRTDSERPAEERAIDLAVSLLEARLPAADAFSGGKDKVTLELSGAATQALQLSAQSARLMLEAWRSNGGSLVIDAAKISKGNLQVDAKGRLGLDAARRVQGELNVAAKGLAPLLMRNGGGNMNPMIGALLERPDGSAVPWPARLQDGRISIGPFRSGQILTPLY